MALMKKGVWATDTTGESETLTLSVVQAVASEDGSASGNAAPTVQIESAFYGEDSEHNPLPVPVNPGGQSITLTTLQAVNPLTYSLISPSDEEVTVQLTQDGTVLAETTVLQRNGTGTLLIEGV